MKWRILVSAPYFQPVVEQYRPIFAVHGAEIIVPVVKERLSEAELLTLVGEIDGVIAGDDRFTRKVLAQAAPRLKVISKWGTGIDSFDHEACHEFGVVVRNTLDAFTDPVADSVMGYVLAFARQLPWMDRQMKGGSWEKIPGRALAETTLGIIGVGRIGKAVARRAAAFGMRLYGNDPVAMPADFLGETGMLMVEKERLLKEADFVTVNCDLNPTSHHLLGADEFRRMKHGAVLINLARGAVVDEPALVNALRGGLVAGAALDVFEEEPLPLDSPLRTLDNVLLAPHNSNSSPRAWERVHQNTIANLFSVLEGVSL